MQLGLEKPEEPEIKWPIYVGSWRKQGNSKKAPTSSSLTVWIETNYKILQENIRPPYLFPEKSDAGQEARVRASHGTTD